MGWVKQRMAQDGEVVEGLIIASGVDEGLMYAASLMPSIRVQTYEVNFRLTDAACIGSSRAGR